MEDAPDLLEGCPIQHLKPDDRLIMALAMAVQILAHKHRDELLVEALQNEVSSWAIGKGLVDG